MDVPDLFYLRYQQGQPNPQSALEVFSRDVSQYIKGFWCDILIEGLERHLCDDKNLDKVKQVAAELFDVMLPQFIGENP